MSRTPGTPRLLRAINDRAALSLLLEHGPLSRVRLGALTGLSKPTASQLLARLEDAGLVVRVGTSAGGRGPNAALYAVNAAAAYVAGADVVPGRLTVGIADITGVIVAEHAIDTEDTDPVPPVRAALRTATRRAGIRTRELARLVIGVPGAHDPVTDTLRYADDELTAWARPGLLGQLRARLRIPVDIENDVNLAAIAERRHGALSGVSSFGLLWVRDGLGLAIDLGGALHRGATGGAGEIGYMPVPGPSRESEGHATPVSDFQDLVGAPAVFQLARAHGLTARSAADAVRRASQGEGGAESFLTELAARLATGLATIVAVLDPELVVLTGDICREGGHALAARVQRRLWQISPLRPTVIASSIEGNPVLLGALDQALEEARDEIFGARDLAQLHRGPAQLRTPIAATATTATPKTPTPTPTTPTRTARSEP